MIRGHMVVKLLEDANEPNGTGTCEEAIMVEQGETNETECKGGTVGSLRFYPGAILEGLWWEES